jgi:phosphohistidine phosphatase
MLTLLLLRHAKSDWSTPGLDDHERPLNIRGTKAAPVMGRYIANKGLKPELVLCSDAVRTQATLTLVLPELGPPPPEVVFDHALYLSRPDTILDVVRDNAKDHTKTIMVISHNPGVHALALTLVGEGDKKSLRQLAMKFPTAALAVITFDAAHWPEVEPTKGNLRSFVTPKEVG